MAEIIQGGVCAPKGFTAASVRCGIKKSAAKDDLALIVSEKDCAAAAVYTQNKVKGAPIAVTRDNIKDGRARAVLCNSGNANTCNADGEEKARMMCKSAADALRIGENDIIVASTGVIGQPLPIEPILSGMNALVEKLSKDGSSDACGAIMTTDLTKKETAVSFILSGVECRLGGIAKGSGMIHPNMATMLAFLTTDAAVSPEMLHKALLQVTGDTFNMVSVDGDTSTNDMASILANGMAGNPEITGGGADFDAFKSALSQVCTYLSREMARDGEGATKLLECTVAGAPDVKTAKTVAKSVITSSLFKAAMFGQDANWGRILCAIGYAPAEFDINKVAVSLSSKAGTVKVCEQGSGIAFSEEVAAKVLAEDEIIISVSLGAGSESATAWGCDLTYDYVKINGDYRT